MNTFNTTYNFNQGNMNFGQALLYGALGSLTGGMGMMGMGGSIFNMGGFGMGGFGCCGGYGMSGWGYTNSVAGAQVGMAGANILSGLISRAVQGGFGGRGGSKNDIIKDDDYYESKAEKSTAVTTAVAAAEQSKDRALGRYIRMSANQESLKKFKNQLISTQGSKKFPDDGDLTEAQKDHNIAIDKIPTIERTLKEQVKDINNELGTNFDINCTREQIEEAADNKIREIKEEAIEKEAKKLKEADEQKAELMEEINEADGNSLSRTRKSKLESRFSDNDSKILGNINNDDVQCALAAYRKASTKGDIIEANKWKTRLKAMKSKIDKENININDNLKDLIDKTIIKD